MYFRYTPDRLPAGTVELPSGFFFKLAPLFGVVSELNSECAVTRVFFGLPGPRLTVVEANDVGGT